MPTGNDYETEGIFGRTVGLVGRHGLLARNVPREVPTDAGSKTHEPAEAAGVYFRGPKECVSSKIPAWGRPMKFATEINTRRTYEH